MTDRDRRRVGIIVPPRYFDTTWQELSQLDRSIDVLTTQMRTDPAFNFGLDEIAGAADEIEACAASLAAAGAEVVLQLGTPFSTVHGWDRANELRGRIERSSGTPFEMMGLSVVQAVHAFGASTVALATGYYDQSWVARYSEFVTDSGLEISSAQSFTDQGHFPSAEAAFEASFVGFSHDLIVASIQEVADSDPTADVILVPGMPGRILTLIPRPGGLCRTSGHELLLDLVERQKPSRPGWRGRVRPAPRPLLTS